MKPTTTQTLLLGAACLIASVRFTTALGGSITLAWNQETDPNVAGYVLYYGNLSGIYSNAFYLDGITNTSATVSNLNQGSTYYFMATAMDFDQLQSPPSSEVSGTVPTTWSAVANLQFTSVSGPSVTLNWTATDPDDTVGFTLYYGTNSGAYVSEVYLDNAANTAATVDGLINGTTYYFTVKAMDADGNESLPSNVVTNSNSFSLNPLSLQITATDTQSVTLAWNQSADPNLVSYMLFFDTTSNVLDDSGASAVNLDGSVTNYTVSGLTSGTTYYFMVMATNSLWMTSTNSNVATVTVPVTNAPAPFQITQIVPAGPQSAEISWVDSDTNAASFQVYWSSNPSNPESGGGDLILGTNDLINGLNAGGTYYFIIVSLDSNFNFITNTAIVPFTMPFPPAPVLQVAPGTTTQSITLTWNDPSIYIQYYQIYYSTTSGYPPTSLGGNITSDTTYTVSGLNPGTIYYFTINATDVAGQTSLYSDEVATNTASLPTAPATPDLYVTATTTSRISLTWDNDTNVDNYTLYYGTNSCNPYQFSTNPPANSLVFGGLPSGTTFYFILAATAGGQNSYSGMIATNTLSIPVNNIVTSTNGPLSIQIQITGTSPDGTQDPNNPIWLHAIFSSPVTNQWVFQDSLDLQNWNTFGAPLPQFNGPTGGWTTVSLFTDLSADFFRVYVMTNY